MFTVIVMLLRELSASRTIVQATVSTHAVRQQYTHCRISSDSLELPPRPAHEVPGTLVDPLCEQTPA